MRRNLLAVEVHGRRRDIGGLVLRFSWALDRFGAAELEVGHGKLCAHLEDLHGEGDGGVDAVWLADDAQHALVSARDSLFNAHLHDTPLLHLLDGLALWTHDLADVM